MFFDIFRHTYTEFTAGRRLWHALDIPGNEHHSVFAIAMEITVATITFTGTAIDDRNEIICDDDAVLAFLLWVLRNDCLFDNLHNCDEEVLGIVWR